MSEAPRPAYVTFEVRAVEDRTRSIEEGRYIAKDVVFAIVTPAGTKDRLEKEAHEWLEGVAEGVKQERIPPEWYDAYKKALERFEESRENPEFGTSVRDWPALSPAQAKLFLDCNIRTVEDVAEMNEEMVGRIGMGARALKAKAQTWLEAAKTVGAPSEELTAIRQENADLRARNEELEIRLKRLEALAPTEPIEPEVVDDEIKEEA